MNWKGSVTPIHYTCNVIFIRIQAISLILQAWCMLPIIILTDESVHSQQCGLKHVCVCVHVSPELLFEWQEVTAHVPGLGLFLQGHLPRAVPAWPWVPRGVLGAGAAVGSAAPQAAQSRGGRWTWPAGPFTSASAGVKSSLVTCNNFSFTLDCSKVLLSKIMFCSLRGSWTTHN